MEDHTFSVSGAGIKRGWSGTEVDLYVPTFFVTPSIVRSQHTHAASSIRARDNMGILVLSA